MAAASRPRVAVLVLGAILAAGIADSVYRVPIQVSDSLDEIVAAAEAPSTAALFAGGLTRDVTTLRPLRRVEVRWLLQLRERLGVSYHAVFRGLHAVLAVALVLLFLAALPVAGWHDAAAAAAGLVVLMGHHTFEGMLREAYPVNHYAVVAAGCLMVAAIARRRPGWIADVAIAVTGAYALLLVESAVLIWVAVITAFIVKLPGIRRRTVILVTVPLAAYFAARLMLGIGAPGIGEHGSGYLDRFYQADELVQAFGGRPWWFMAYNAQGALSSVLASEPRYGVYATLAAWRTGALSPVVVIHLVSSVIASVALGWHLRARWRQRRNATEADRLLVLAVVMIAANSALTVSYMKDEIISVAGAFYALALALTARALVAQSPPARTVVTAGASVALVVCALLWGFRAAGLHFQLRNGAVPTRSDWVWSVDPSELSRWSTSSRGRTVVLRIRSEAILRGGTSRRFLPEWGERYWSE
jgi:hypothetical protein